MAKLFDDGEAPGVATTHTRVVGVAAAAGVWRTFDYVWPDEFGEPSIGQRIRVPFGKGNRATLGFVADTLRRPPARELKTVAEVIDAEPQLDAPLWKLGEWISRYYLSPLGMTLAAMVPSAVGRHAPKTETAALLTSTPKDWPRSLGSRMKRALDELLEAKKQGVEELRLEELRHHSGASRDTIGRLVRRDLIRLENRPVTLPELSDTAAADPFELNDDQKSALAALQPKLAGGFSATLLYGVTGSGKTEIYIRAIRSIIEAGRQAILLVPEIALATQTLQRLIKRLPRVAVLHSGLTGAQRAFYWRQIRQGNASVVVGPRSAVFAPARKLGLIIVDEEHETSYKQDTAPRYHGRDVAVKRAALEGVPVLLGSATPSMESLRNVHAGRYEMLRLPHRVRGLPMPKLSIVNLREEIEPGKLELIGRTLTRKIAATLDQRRQVILLMNRRGYASYVFCPASGWIFMCEECSRPMVYHRAIRTAMCHHCDRTAPLPERCPVSGGKLVFFGYGIQRIENELSRKFPTARVARMDSDTMTSQRQFQTVFDAFAAGDVEILLGTQMVAKGLDFPGVTLVGIASADTSLAIPDFRAAERTFQLIVQVAGRAGRADLPGEVVVQTLHADDPAVQFAAEHDYDGFAAGELPSRKETNLPPFSRLVRFIARHTNPSTALEGAETLAARLAKLLPRGQVTMIGPQAAGVKKIRNQYRFVILLKCASAGVIQRAVYPQMEALCRGIPAEIAADADPIQLL